MRSERFSSLAICLCALIAVASPALPQDETNEAQRQVRAFLGLCLSGLPDIERFAHDLDVMGYEVALHDRIRFKGNQPPPASGRTWIIEEQGETPLLLNLSASPEGEPQREMCTIYGVTADADQVADFLETSGELGEKIEDDNNGEKRQRLWVTANEDGRIVLMVDGGPGNIDGVVLALIGPMP